MSYSVVSVPGMKQDRAEASEKLSIELNRTLMDNPMFEFSIRWFRYLRYFYVIE